MLLARRWAGALVVDNTVYVIGGIGGRGGTYEKRLDSVECLELTEEGGKRWKQLAPMSTPRSSHTCEVMDGLIYVVGGGDGKDWLCSAEVNIISPSASFVFACLFSQLKHNIQGDPRESPICIRPV